MAFAIGFSQSVNVGVPRLSKQKNKTNKNGALRTNPVDLSAAIESLRRWAATNVHPDPKAQTDFFLRQAHLIVAAQQLQHLVPEPMTPAVRTRWLANAFHSLADLLDQCPPGPLGFDIMTEVAEKMRVNAAWRAFHGLTDLLKDRRVMLIGCIVVGAATMEPVSTRHAKELAEQRRRLAARGIRMKPVKVKAGMVATDALTSVQATERVRQLYSASFPKVAAKLDAAKLEGAIRAWSNPSGKPKKGASTSPKWEVISDLMRSAAILGSATTDIKRDSANLKREWLKFKREQQCRVREIQAEMEPWSVRTFEPVAS
jgi:hypothetical protein